MMLGLLLIKVNDASVRKGIQLNLLWDEETVTHIAGVDADQHGIARGIPGMVAL
jgi:hypothetical protein